MTYPGNPTISPEVQQRIRSTFEQTLGLAERGSHQEAALGCDFVLQLDPQFLPARSLAERLSQTDGAVPVDDLRDMLAGRPSAAERKAEADALFGAEDDGEVRSEDFDLGADLGDDVGVDLGEEAGAGLLGDFDDAPADGLADLDAELPEIGVPGDDAPGEGFAGAVELDLRERLEDLFDERRYEELVALAGEHGERVSEDARIGHLAATAAARLEAAPYVEKFVAAARRAHEKGDDAEAEALLDKARALDPSHPGLDADAVAASTVSPPPAAAPPAGEGALAADPLADEGDPRIAELLHEGQAAFDRDDHQGAIDAWSRIFLIDIDHAEASRRIEEARRVKSERERRVEEAYHDALTELEAGRFEAAREGLARVLELAPGHLAAREQLDRIDAGMTPVPPTRPLPASGAEPVPVLEPAPEPLKEEILVPPDPGAERTADDAPAPPSYAGARAGAPRRFALIGSAVLVLVLAGAWIVWQQWDSFFPNAEDQPAAATEVDPIARAIRLHESGRTAMAINQLRRLPPSSPQYGEAQALISQWEAAGQPTADGDDDGDAAAAEQDAERQAALVAAAAEAAAAGENLRARTLLVEAEGLAPLDAAGEALKAETEAALRPLGRYIDLLAQGEQQRALPELWQLHEEDPRDPDVRRLIADAYYNLAARSLLQGDASRASEHLREVLRMEPDNADAERLARFAQTYAQREKDLLYRIYVKYLPPR